jgi:hypothetical protein
MAAYVPRGIDGIAGTWFKSGPGSGIISPTLEEPEPLREVGPPGQIRLGMAQKGRASEISVKEGPWGNFFSRRLQQIPDESVYTFAFYVQAFAKPSIWAVM